ncbi:MAG: hypothetical protein JSS21_05805 [Proteobacteria bacterium]|nr:hypothetical protein [Pseudomonadota bacterium]
MQSQRDSRFRGVLLAATFALAVLASGAQAQTYNLRVLHRFTGATNAGKEPATGVRFDSAGNLYGTTDGDNVGNYETIFKIATDGTYSVIHSFDNGAGATGGWLPNGLTIDPVTGDIYGTTTFGGDSICFAGYGSVGDGCGVLYKLAADGTFTVLHTFEGQFDGANPLTDLTHDAQSNVYGTTNSGGTGFRGTVFEYRADGTYIVLYTFTTGGCYATTPVIPDDAGNLYGGAFCGQGGAIYKLKPDGPLTILHRFSEGFPVSLVAGHDGSLYGTTESLSLSDDGTVFKLARGGAFTTLYQFTGEADGIFSNTVLPVGDDLYGTEGYNGLGKIFKIASDGSFTTVYDMTPDSGTYPAGRLTLKNGRLYGTAEGGGFPRADAGTVYSVGIAGP